MAAGVEVDTSRLARAVRQLANGLDTASGRVAFAQASRVANAIRPNVPVLTGRLRSTVAAQRESRGASVTYGGDLPYARKIERRTGAVEDGVAGADEEFRAAMLRAAQAEVARL